MDAARLTNEIAGAFVQEMYDANAVVTTNAALRERIKVLGSTARITSEAVPPKSKDPLQAAVAMLLGILLGGALGAGSGLAFTLLDRRLRAAEQLAAVSVLLFPAPERGRLPSGGSTACDRSSLRGPIVASASASWDLGQRSRESTRHLLTHSKRHFGAARRHYGKSRFTLIFWLAPQRARLCLRALLRGQPA